MVGEEDEREEDEREETPAEFLRDLAERLRHIPVAYGTDDFDISRLGWAAKLFENAGIQWDG